MSSAVAFLLKGDWDEQPVGSAPKMTSSTTTRPPGFVQCYVCQREFGSRSIEIHEPQCLEKWKARNAKLPKTRRERTPSPPPGHPLHADERADMTPSPAAYTPTSDPDELSTSWSHPGKPPSQPQNGRPRSASFSEGRRKVRPSTATLEKPKVLDMSLRHEVDMSEMRRDMLDQVILTKDTHGESSDYSSDFTSSSPSSMGSKSPFDDEATSEGSEGEAKKVRPSTMRLPRPSRHIAVPVITAQNSRPSKKTSNLRSFLPRGRRRQLEEVFTGPKDKVKIPEPCLTCGKEQNPERFHSHPLDIMKFKPKTEERAKARALSKLIVTKPTALKYKSRGIDTENKAPAGRKSKQKPSTANKKSRSVDNSPAPAKKGQSAIPLKKFISEQKASMNKDKEFTVEIFDAQTSPRSEDSSSPPQPQRRREPSKQNGETERKKGAPPPPRHMNKIEEERESRPEETTKTRRPENGSRGGQRLGTVPTLVCYICGREFGSRSLAIHQPQCLEKWRRENEKLPRNLQRPEPELPEHELTHEEWNEYAWKTAQAQLVPCEWCGRTFFPERLEVHQRGCKPPPGAPKKSQRSSTRPDTSTNLNASMSMSKPTIVCYICGREFGSSSIKIHEPQCLKKWRIQNENLPDNLKRPEPKKPEMVYNEEGKVDKEAMAEAAWKTHLDTLVACKCGRTFFPDRLIVHQKACLKEA
ncbi:zinc finger protein 474-like isoform X1 [Penaeus japonicus]|uniref:zinc finger protein 474-like isoform X1 n=2 Tax=Penaeus japonicus TaxID=27405 RepID=UPI001C712349|nr:zinc finger protein 474-like isoform X1 [Penaeus japonicus]